MESILHLIGLALLVVLLVRMLRPAPPQQVIYVQSAPQSHHAAAMCLIVFLCVAFVLAFLRVF